MGNCLSTLRRLFKCGNASVSNEEVPLEVMPHSTSKDNAQNPPEAPGGGNEIAFPIGSIELPAGSVRNEADSVQSTAVESSYSQRDDNLHHAMSGSDPASQSGSGAQSPDGDDSTNEITLEEAEIQTVRRTSILRVGPARIVSTRSAGNIRSVSFVLPNDHPDSDLQQSATMSNIKSSPQESANDPVANYIKKNAETIEAAKKKWNKFASDNQVQDDAQDGKNVQTKEPDLYLVPFYDEADSGERDAEKHGMGTPTHACAPSMVYTQQIRDLGNMSRHMMSPRLPRYVQSINHLRADSKVSPGTVGSPFLSPPTSVSQLPRRGSSDPSSPLLNSPNMAYQSDINARRGLARLQELDGTNPLDRLFAFREREYQMASTERRVTTSKSPESSNKAAQTPSEDEQEEEIEDDETLMEKALALVGQSLMLARARILNKVRKHEEDEMHASYITEAILGLDDDIVEECAHADNTDSQNLIRNQVAKIRRISSIEMSIERVTDADLDYFADSTKKRKAEELVKIWKAQAQAKIEAKQKGKGKAVQAA